MPLAPEIHPVTSERWGDLERLFERPLGPRGGKPVTAACWCMAWRAPADEFRRGWGSGATRGQGNKAALRTVVDDGRVPGLLAYADGEPVGWCSIAPREDFVALESSRALARIDDQPVWSVVCFYVDPSAKRAGLGTTLLRAAVDYARSCGARIVEGYACKPGDRDPFTGFESMFEATGFVKVRAGGRRSTWRYAV
jgi:GNAT superfamily N-acetyltransferase